jgi:integrase
MSAISAMDSLSAPHSFWNRALRVAWQCEWLVAFRPTPKLLRGWRKAQVVRGPGWNKEPSPVRVARFGCTFKKRAMGQSTVKKAHLRALKLSKVAPFVLYDLRLTCLTRRAQYLDAFTLRELAGHESLRTTMKYVHLNERDSDLG